MNVVAYSKKTPFASYLPKVPLKEQNDRMRDYAKDNGWKISKFYEDKSDDPNSDNAYQKLRIDGMNKRYDLIIMDSIMRFGKNFTYAYQLLYRTFYNLGINFVVVEDDFNSLNVKYEEVEDYFYKKNKLYSGLSGSQSRIEDFNEKKSFLYMKSRYGYRLNEDCSKMIIDEKASQVIHMIFDMYEKGFSTDDIVCKLNEKKIESPEVYIQRVGNSRRYIKQKKWKESAVLHIRKDKHLMGKTDSLLCGEITFPRIIEPEQFNRVNKENKKRWNGNRKDFINVFLHRVVSANSGEILFCVEIKNEHFFCHRNSRTKPLISYQDLMDNVMKCLEQECKQAEYVLNKIYKGENESYINKIKGKYKIKATNLFELSLEIVQNKIILYQQYEKGEVSDLDYNNRISEIDSKQEKVNNQFSELMNKLKSEIKEIDRKNAWIERFIKYNYHTPPNRHELSRLIKQITIDDNKNIIITMNTDGKEAFPEEWLKEAINNGKKK
ncbi:MAG: recombinase family protein [Lachnospiraceae bacterium]|nr:recombinase family protein [Lachnospiraceae bacterium]